MKAKLRSRPSQRWNWSLVQGRLVTAIGDDQIHQLHAYLPPDGEPSPDDIDHAMLLAGVKEISPEPPSRRRRAQVAH